MKHFFRIVSLAVCLAMCMALLPVSIQATNTVEVDAPEIPTEGDVWDGSITQPTTLVQKDGVYYYEISSAAELAYVAQTGGEWLGYNYILGNNLILNDVELTWDEDGHLTNTESLLEWTPINSFSGTFDGKGCIISGLYIYTPYQSDIGLFASLKGTVQNLIITNSYVCGNQCVGLLCGKTGRITYQTISECEVDGVVCGSSYVGGCIGYDDGHQTKNLINYADVYCAGDHAGGISSDLYIRNGGYLNYGTISSKGNLVGGICAIGSMEEAINFGSVFGNIYVGGIVGAGDYGHTIRECMNFGSVSGTKSVGGIIGYSGNTINSNVTTQNVLNCANLGTISGTEEVGGLIGTMNHTTMKHNYSIGIVHGALNFGGIAGTSDHVWGRSVLYNNYYIQAAGISAFGGVVEDSTGNYQKKNHASLILQATYNEWDFSSIWGMSPDINNGFPYIQTTKDFLQSIAVKGIEISENNISLSIGESGYLSAAVLPFNASNQTITWSSSDDNVASVSAAGKVTAISAGTATITAATEDGGYEDSCIVTVTERFADEYQINSIAVRDSDGEVLSVLPDEVFLATVSITNLASEGNTHVLLAAYTDAGQYQGMMWVSIEDLSVGATCKVTLPVDNSDGKIENLKAFTVASFSNLTPLGDVVSFLTE